MIKFQDILREVYQAKVVRQSGAHFHRVELHHAGHGETKHTAGQSRENVFGHSQLRFYRSVCTRDVCQSNLVFQLYF